MKKEMILKVNENEIYSQKMELKETMETAQQYLEWHNEIEFCKKLEVIEEIKEFLTSPHAFYENEVRSRLAELTGLKTLPNNIENLTSMYEIPECEAWSLSESFGFEYLKVDDNGQLFYDAAIFDKVQTDNTVYATPEQAQALAELERTWSNIEKISELYPEGAYRNKFLAAVKIVFADIFYKKPSLGNDDGTQVKWNVDKLMALSELNFGKHQK